MSCWLGVVVPSAVYETHHSSPSPPQSPSRCCIVRLHFILTSTPSHEPTRGRLCSGFPGATEGAMPKTFHQHDLPCENPSLGSATAFTSDIPDNVQQRPSVTPYRGRTRLDSAAIELWPTFHFSRLANAQLSTEGTSKRRQEGVKKKKRNGMKEGRRP